MSSELTTRSRDARRMTIDLASVPPLNLPSPASNTLIITNIENPLIFRNENLMTIKGLIHNITPIHTWAPLKSFRRIIVSFFDVNSAIQIRQLIESDAILGERCKVYFGHPTPIETKEAHLNLPDAGKLFFISPPPSPPHGWENRLEDAPNKQVVAEDLAKALNNLHTSTRSCFPESPISDSGELGCRTRSASCTTIYRPEEHGGSPNLPAINVEDTTGDDCEPLPIEQEKSIYAHTCRPPLELMDISTP
ncbi:putative calcipressin family protein [Erysiphe neolycopersici]|uniref:Putative calcipressin family protein n=1 Tax=Erysiphe neolycopersici TaxID=212602 RepID=A0A420HSW9_9PEZI|nr:putative calcipressin family protein [Erysiphe neolycopersici]